MRNPFKREWTKLKWQMLLVQDVAVMNLTDAMSKRLDGTGDREDILKLVTFALSDNGKVGAVEWASIGKRLGVFDANQMNLAERVRRGKVAISMARQRGIDTSEWERHLRELEKQRGVIDE
tara:strand:- start:767 stop:1129 length:363 start_codon:yes stop_codon:yes gene_type:complete